MPWRLVEETLRLLARKARGAGIILVDRSKPGLLPVMVDRGQIRQVLVNLLLNAIQARPKGLEISVHLEQKGSSCGGGSWSGGRGRRRAAATYIRAFLHNPPQRAVEQPGAVRELLDHPAARRRDGARNRTGSILEM